MVSSAMALTPLIKEEKMTTFMTRGGHRIRYVDKGEGKPVVLIHGWSGSSENFVFLKKDLLKNHYRVIAVDLRGHGESDVPETPPLIEDLADDVHELIQHLRLSEFSLLGYSMGVFVSFEYILKYNPNNIKHLILVDMTPKLIADKKEATGLYHAGVVEEEVPAFLDEMRDDFTKWWFGFFKKVSLLPMTPENEKIATEALGDYDLDVLVTLFQDMFAKDYRQKLKDVKVPTTLIYAEPGSLYSINDALAMKRALPQLKLVPIANSTHLLVLTHPEPFAKAVLDALKI